MHFFIGSVGRHVTVDHETVGFNLEILDRIAGQAIHQILWSRRFKSSIYWAQAGLFSAQGGAVDRYKAHKYSNLVGFGR